MHDEIADWAIALCLTFSPLQFPLHGLPDQVRALFTLVQDGIHASQRPFREPGRHLLVIYLLAPHPDWNT